VQFQSSPEPIPGASLFLSVGERRVPVILVRNLRARRYVLRLRHDGIARVTIPRGGSFAAGRAFAGRHASWLARQLRRLDEQPRQPALWQLGAELLFRGEVVRLEAGSNGSAGTVQVGTECVSISDPSADLRPAIEKHLRRIAERELPPRVTELAALHQLSIRRVSVRNQKSRWGSCSRRGTISLNWRLIQTPAFVQDYIILHELMHLRQMNHSPRFWREVETACPEYRTAELWLKQHSDLLRG